MNYKYMHTMDGKPAVFEPEYGQIFFANRGKFGCVKLADTIDQIRNERRISERTRRKQKFAFVPTAMGHCMVLMTEQQKGKI